MARRGVAMWYPPSDWYQILDEARTNVRLTARIIPSYHSREQPEILGYVFAYEYGGASDVTLRTKEECETIQKGYRDALDRSLAVQRKVFEAQGKYQAYLDRRAEKAEYAKYNNLKEWERLDQQKKSRVGSQKRISSVSDGYVRRLLGTGAKNAPTEMLEAKRLQIKIKRILKRKS